MKNRPNRSTKRRSTAKPRTGRRPSQLLLAVINAAIPAATAAIVAWALAHIPW
ncbi:hypothetical protein OG365_41005 (plasmid) [Streptomyces sp. NBC_00853]|uniref:hypothetical protein n=1 Tax=Streptomyces sp. NBC_00853 TaxID=2903681 RepID=UPI002F907B88|nr:hypothetical protein OG365_41005 [Streptomyces sp. NBC_00853]